MPIDAVCPECQNRFRLQEGMVGKSMRCPVCQEVFVVKEAAPAAGGKGPGEKPPATDTPPRSRSDIPPVVSRSGSVSDFVPVITDVAPARPAPAAPPRPTPPAPAQPQVVTTPPPPRPAAGRPPATPVKPPAAGDFPWDEGPKTKPAPVELKWTPTVAPPVNPEAPPIPLRPADDEPIDLRPAEEEVVALAPTRPPKSKKRLGVLLGMVAFVVLALGVGGFFLVRYINDAPERLLAAGRKDYEAANYDQARRVFDQLVTEYPTHRLVPEARFFGELSALRGALRSPMMAEDPTPGLAQWKKFLDALNDPDVGPFAAKGRFAIDVWQAGDKLADDLATKAGRSLNPDAPDEAEKWMAELDAVEKDLDRFRPDEEPRKESRAKAVAELRQQIEVARIRADKLNELEKLLGDGSDESIGVADKRALELGMDKDHAYLAMKDRVEQRIQAKATYVREPQPIPPTAVPDDGLTSLLFAPRFDRGDRRAQPGLTSVFFCLARGVLYALDEPDGRVLWAARTGLDTDIMPVRVPASDQNPEMVLVASNTGNQFGITARQGRNGVPLWHHALAVPCQGPAVVVGPHAYVPLSDKDGTVLEIALGAGEVTGRLIIGRPLGPTLVARPGTGHLYVVAESRAVYVFDVDRHGPLPDFKREEPKLLGVMNTGHPTGSLRGVPVFSNPDPNEPGPRFFVLGQASGIDTMKLRAFRLADTPDGSPDPNPVAKEIALPGWASFPPHCDGEKVAVVTDQGEFGLYGLALAGNKDEDLFSFPSRPPGPGEMRPSRGQVVLAEEGAFWILSGGELRRLRFGISPGAGVHMIQHGDAIPAGEPLHAPQVNPRGDTFVVVTQDGMTCRATAVDARTGQTRWRRELGVMVKGDPLRIGNAVLLLDHAGGMYRIDTKPFTALRSAAWLVDPDDQWLMAQPARGFTAVTGLIPAANGTAVALLAGETETGPVLLVRKYTGAGVQDRRFPATAPLAGQPVVSGNMLVLPLANGTLRRLNLADPAGVLEEGPSWRGDRLSRTAVCYLAPMDPDTLFATDGARSVVRWRWPANSKVFEMEGRLTLSEKLAATPAVVPGSPKGLVLADGKGNLTLWDADRLNPPALKAWRSGEKGLPPGPVQDGLRLESEPGRGPRVVYSAGGRLVWLPPDADGPKWVGPPPYKATEGRPVLDGGRILLTDRAGIVDTLDAVTGKEVREEFRLTGSHAFASAAVPIGPKQFTLPLTDGVGVWLCPIRINQFLVPLADGTLVLGELVWRPEEPPPAKKPKEKDPEDSVPTDKAPKKKGPKDQEPKGKAPEGEPAGKKE